MEYIGKTYNGVKILRPTGKRCKDGSVEVYCKCERCGEEGIFNRRSVIRSKNGCCGCNHKSGTTLTKPQIISKITRLTKIDNNTGCWEWSGLTFKNGYGRMIALGDNSVHRISYMVFKGSIGKGMNICHTCDNRKCANPEHLFEGTGRDNAMDAIEKGRYNTTRNNLTGKFAKEIS